MSDMKNGQFLAGSGLDADQLSQADTLTRSQGSTGIIPRFYTHTVSAGDGKFIDEELVELLVPGDAKSAPHLLVDERVKRRFPAQYKAWKEGREVAQEGTPLEILLGQTALLHTLKASHIHTVEQLAGLTDGQLNAIPMGGRELRERAKRMLDVQSVARDAAKEEARDREMQDMRETIAKLTAQLSGSAAPASENDPVSEKAPEGAVPAPASNPRKARQANAEAA